MKYLTMLLNQILRKQKEPKSVKVIDVNDNNSISQNNSVSKVELKKENATPAENDTKSQNNTVPKVDLKIGREKGFSKSSNFDNTNLGYSEPKFSKIKRHLFKNKIIYIGISLVILASIITAIY